MARSSYVYVLTTKGGEPAHGFTVKHELLSFMRRLPDGALKARSVFRLGDGSRDGTVYSWPAEQYLKEEPR